MLFFFFFALLIVGNRAAPIGSGLYLPDDDVEILNVDNFKTTVGNTTGAWFIEFYASWCGYCQRFSSPWKKFAKEIAPWRDVVRVGVVDCSEKKNIDLCRDFEIVGYPTIRYFKGGKIDKGEEVPHGNSDQATPGRLKKMIIDWMVGKNYPQVLPYEEGDIFKGVSDDTQYVFLVVAQGILGAEISLDLHHTPKIAIKYSSENNTKLIEDLKIEKLPSLLVFDRNNNNPQIFYNVTNKNETKITIKEFLATKGLDLVEKIPDKINKDEAFTDPKQREKSILRGYIKKMGDVIFQADLEAAIRYSLQTEVATVKVIKGQQLEALKGYVKVLQKYFPFGYNKTSLINQLSNLTSKNNEIPGAKIESLVKDAENKNIFSSTQQFLGCMGSSPRYRGYPCSLWRLFHFLTVHSVEYNTNNKKANPREVLDAMHGYVKNFFSCEKCSEHFQEMAASRNLSSVSSLDGAVMWLWEAHNVVNQRLKSDASEDPEYPKQQFPTREHCPECYNNDSDNTWNRKKVREYLQNMYSVYNIRFIGSDTKILFPGLD